MGSKDKYRILHLEDVSSDSEMVVREIKAGNIDFEYQLIDTEKEYLEALDNFHPDVILCDHTLPSFNSFEALRILKAKKLNIPFIVITATMTEEVALNIVREGADDYILKDRLKRVPHAVINAIEKFRFEKERIQLIDAVHQQEALSKQALRESEERYRTLFEQNLAGFYQSTLEGEILNCNMAFANMLKYDSPEELLKINANELYYSSSDRKEFTDNVINVKKLKNFEGALKCKDGSAIYFLESISMRVNEVTGKKFFDGILIDITERKKADDKLLNTSKALQSALKEVNKIMDSSMDLICTIDREGKFVTVSAACERILGYKPAELRGRKYLDFIYSEDIEKTNIIASEIFSGISVTAFENRYVRKNSTPIDLLWSARWDEKENLMYCIAKDATEKKLLERSFEIESKRFSDLFLQAPTSIGVLKGPNHVFTLANPLYLQLIGKEDIIGKSVIEVVPEVADQGLIKILDEVYNTGVPYSAKEMLIQLNQKGSVKRIDKYLDFVYQAYNNFRGEREGIFFFAVDVTEQVLSRKKIEESNERFLNVSKATFDVVWDWDIKTKVLFLGNGYQELFGYDVNETNDFMSWSAHIHPEDKERVITTRLNKIIHQDELNWVDEYRYIRGNGTIAHVTDRGILLRDESGTYRMIGAMQDVTSLKEKERSILSLNISLKKRAEELAASNSELEQFAYVASHDLQEPLRMITGFLSQLEKKYSSIIDEKGRQYIYFAVDGATRMRQIILDLLEFSRIGRVQYSPKRTDLTNLINDIKILCKTQAEEKNAIINSDNLPVINAYPTPLRQVFQNLISNALKYSRKNIPVSIDISANELDDHWQFAVADNGIGIAEEYYEKIFIIFQRLHNKNEYSGTGMGLAITRKIVESLGGKIWIISEEGKGSIFYFTILKDLK